MKRFVSLALAAAMTLSIAPVSAFAVTNNRIDRVATVTEDYTFGTDAPVLTILNGDGDINTTKNLEFSLNLEGASFANDGLDLEIYNPTLSQWVKPGASTANGAFTVSISSSKKVYITIPSGSTEIMPGTGSELKIRLNGVEVNDPTAKITVEPENSAVSRTTHTFAKSASGGAIITVDGKKDFADGDEVNPIYIEEITPTSLTSDGTGVIKLKLNSGFKFNTSNLKVEIIKGAGSSYSQINGSSSNVDVDGRDLTITIPNDYLDSGAGATVSIIKISGLRINEDGAKYGDTADITVSSDKMGDMDKTTLEMGKFVDYGVNVSTQDKDLPVVYSGMDYADDENRTLELTVKEGVVDSWFVGSRKTTFTFPEGVKVRDINVESESNFGTANSKSVIQTAIKNGIDGNVVTLSPLSGTTDESGKKELVLTFDLWVAPDFTGDITCEVGGPAVNENQKVTIAKAVAPLSIEAAKTPVSIDYRNVSVGDITITEAEAGLWGKNESIILNVENMQFESGMKAEVVEGDGEIKKLDVDKGNVKITVDSESSKTPMKIKLSGISLYLDRSLPVGDYALNVINGTNPASTTPNLVMFQTYNTDDGNTPIGSNAGKFGFDVNEVEMMKDYVTVTTAGRDQGTTFTTEVVVTIDSTTMKVDGKDVTLETPAYLSAEGWTMLPIRAVTEALATSSNTQPVDWIPGNPGTIIIRYGDKTVSMTLGSTTMYINGTPIPMSTAPTIVNDRAFLPMRDLGRALGLTENEIVWDAATRTATLNPATKTTTNK